MSEVEYECSLCGMNLSGVKAPEGCDICHGGAQVQERAYTLTDHRAGRAPEEDRYTDLRPSSSPLVFGGAVGHPGLR